MFRAYRTADPRSAFDEYVCPRCRFPVVVPAGEAPRSMICSRDGWPLITLDAFQRCDGDPLLGMELPGGFTPIDAVGSGSSAVVYRATVAPPSARRAAGRPDGEPAPASVRAFAAVKIMRLDGADQAIALDAWEREVSALENLRAPHLVRLLDSGRVTHPASFFVALEWLDGVSLDAVAELDVPEALELTEHVAVGLAALHARGFVHGDVKPRNAMCGPRGATLFDLGSSFVEGTRQPGVSEPLFRASPAYAAPERVLGGRATRAADTYSLGAMLFRLIARRTIFEGSAESVARAQVDEPPPRVSDVAPRAVRDDVLRRDLDAALDALLAKDPSHRPADPVGLLRGLRNRSMKVYDREPNV